MNGAAQVEQRPVRCVCGAQLALQDPDGTLHIRRKMEMWVDPPFSKVRLRCYQCTRIRVVWDGGK